MSGGPPVILVHGGAGHVPEDGVGPRRRGCAEAARAGHAVLRAGGEALDAVEAAVAALEDDPLFNAGTGAVLCRDGRVRLDAAVMDGSRLAAGAVAALERMPNPVRVARSTTGATSCWSARARSTSRGRPGSRRAPPRS